MTTILADFTYDSAPDFAQFAHLCTGKERDAESGWDYFGARYYGSSMGRMMSPKRSLCVREARQSADPRSLLVQDDVTTLLVTVGRSRGRPSFDTCALAPVQLRSLDLHLSGNNVCAVGVYTGKDVDRFSSEVGHV